MALLEFLLVADPSSVDPLKFSQITTVMTDPGFKGYGLELGSCLDDGGAREHSAGPVIGRNGNLPQISQIEVKIQKNI